MGVDISDEIFEGGENDFYCKGKGLTDPSKIKFIGKEVFYHPVYLTNIKINFPNSGKVNQKLLDFFVDVYSGSLRNT